MTSPSTPGSTGNMCVVSLGINYLTKSIPLKGKEATRKFRPCVQIDFLALPPFNDSTLRV
jgi:hypothetical protein